LAQQLIDAAVRTATAAGRHEVSDRDLLAAIVATPKGKLAQVLRPDSAAVRVLREALSPGRAPADQPSPAVGRRREAAPRTAPPAAEPRRARSERPRARDRSAPSPPEPRPEPAPASAKTPPKPTRSGRWFLLLLAALPASIALNYWHAPAIAVFATACLGILPLAGLMGEATEALAERTGPTMGGLLNATFGNAAELIIALVALRSGLVDLVKASITGSILGNLLLILGLSCIAGGSGRVTIRFSRTNAGMSAAMLALAVIGLVFPALFHAAHGPAEGRAELRLSEIVAAILIVTYGLSLLFSLRTHRALFGGGDVDPHSAQGWGVGRAVIVLALATGGVVVASELLVHSVEGVTTQLGLSEAFLGLVIIPLIGNAAEHATAVVVARKGQMDLAFQIALGSSTQIALLVAPLLVFAGLALGVSMNLVFPVFEVVALAVATLVIAIITLDGETHWFEGVQLLAVYGLLATAAYFI
jgi:Ca2+:H+ antiporter